MTHTGHTGRVMRWVMEIDIVYDKNTNHCCLILTQYSLQIIEETFNTNPLSNTWKGNVIMWFVSFFLIHVRQWYILMTFNLWSIKLNLRYHTDPQAIVRVEVINRHHPEADNNDANNKTTEWGNRLKFWNITMVVMVFDSILTNDAIIPNTVVLNQSEAGTPFLC